MDKDPETFRKEGKEMVDFIADYWSSIRDRPVLPSVKQDYLTPILPLEAPEDPEPLADVLKDVQENIFPGITQWQHPHFFAYYPSAASHAALLADMLSDALGVVGFTWASSPACTDLERVMMNWLAKMLKLPEQFLWTEGGKGGGVIQGTASEATLVAMLAARAHQIQEHREAGKATEGLVDKMICYASDQVHCSVEKASAICHTEFRSVDGDEKGAMTGDSLELAIIEDVSAGLVPYCVVATLGTTPTCSFDDLPSIGSVCKKYGLWLHVDAAYAGSALICPEFRYLGDGLELADSFNFNPHKWMRVTFDCSAMWMNDCNRLADAFVFDSVFLQHKHTENRKQDLKNLQIPLGRRFRSLKMWFVFRLYGVKQLQEDIRQHVRLAKVFESLVKQDDRFEVTNTVTLGLVCFRLKGTNKLNDDLVKRINETDRRIHLVPGKVKDSLFLRFALANLQTTEVDVLFAWSVITELASDVLTDNAACVNCVCM